MVKELGVSMFVLPQYFLTVLTELYQESQRKRIMRLVKVNFEIINTIIQSFVAQKKNEENKSLNYLPHDSNQQRAIILNKSCCLNVFIVSLPLTC